MAPGPPEISGGQAGTAWAPPIGRPEKRFAGAHKSALCLLFNSDSGFARRVGRTGETTLRRSERAGDEGETQTSEMGTEEGPAGAAKIRATGWEGGRGTVGVGGLRQGTGEKKRKNAGPAPQRPRRVGSRGRSQGCGGPESARRERGGHPGAEATEGRRPAYAPEAAMPLARLQRPARRVRGAGARGRPGASLDAGPRGAGCALHRPRL